jgi:PncC family amidohydrolase
MNLQLKNMIEVLTNKHKTMATMESCTGGGLANAITNIEGASEVFKFGAITYSNEYKMKMGVDTNVIEKYSVYSINTAMEMAHKISLFTNADYGIGITGKLNRVDKHNPYGKDNIVFISIYDKSNNEFINDKIETVLENRILNKEIVINKIISILSTTIDCEE